jgi:hypothetical protein
VTSDILARENIAAWCIVPYDSRRRTPRERAAMLAELGIGALVWDWRDEHLPSFEEELDALAEKGIDLLGMWGPAVGDTAAVAGLVTAAAKRGLAPQLWTCIEYGPPWEGPPPPNHAERVARAAATIEPLARLAVDHGMTVGLYNHMGWFGEPEHQVDIADALAERGLEIVGLVYQQHHGHAHLDRWEELWPAIAPRVIAVGLNGMVPPSVDPRAATSAPKIHPYGRGPRDVGLAQVVVDSHWQGPVTILGHTMDDVELRILDNLEGLDWVRSRLAGGGPEEPPPARIPEPVWPH